MFLKYLIVFEYTLASQRVGQNPAEFLLRGVGVKWEPW